MNGGAISKMGTNREKGVYVCVCACVCVCVCVEEDMEKLAMES